MQIFPLPLHCKVLTKIFILFCFGIHPTPILRAGFLSLQTEITKCMCGAWFTHTGSQGFEKSYMVLSRVQSLCSGQSSSQVSETIGNFASLEGPMRGWNILGCRPPTQHSSGFNSTYMFHMYRSCCPKSVLLQLNTKRSEIVNDLPGNATLLFHSVTLPVTAFPESSSSPSPCLSTVEH